MDCAVYDGTLLASGQGSSGDAGGGAQPDPGGDGGALNSGGANSEVGAGNGGAAGDDSPGVGGGAGGKAGDAGASSGGGHAGAIGAGGASGHAGANAGGAGGAMGTAGSGGVSGSAGTVGGGAPGGMGGAGVGGAGAGGAAAGNGGSGGAVGGVVCADHPFTTKTNWVATASSQSTNPVNPASKLTDGTAARWSSGKPQEGDEWIQVDFGATTSVRSINLQQGSDTNDYPRSYAVIVSSSAKDLSGTVLASGIGTGGVTTTITLPKVVSGRYLLIKQLGSSLSWWSVAEVEPACIDN